MSKVCYKCAPVLGIDKDACVRGDLDECAGCTGVSTHFAEVELDDISRRRLKKASDERIHELLSAAAATPDGAAFIAKAFASDAMSKGRKPGPAS